MFFVLNFIVVRYNPLHPVAADGQYSDMASGSNYVGVTESFRQAA